MSSPFEPRLTTILRESLTRQLKPLGFRKNRNLYTQHQTECSWLVDVERGLYNTDREAEFTLECGIYVCGVVSIYINGSEPKAPKITDCCLRARIGTLSGDLRDKWWKMNINDDVATVDTQTIREIRGRMEQQALPFLNRFPSRRSVIEYLESPRSPREQSVWPQSEIISLAYAGILYWLEGNLEKAAEVLLETVERDKRSPADGHMENLYVRLCSASP